MDILEQEHSTCDHRSSWQPQWTRTRLSVTEFAIAAAKSPVADITIGRNFREEFLCSIEFLLELWIHLSVLTTYEERLTTFASWPHSSPRTQPAQLAAAGFIHHTHKYSPVTVQCPACTYEQDLWHHDGDALRTRNENDLANAR